jgi:hypothetical protein
MPPAAEATVTRERSENNNTNSSDRNNGINLLDLREIGREVNDVKGGGNQQGPRVPEEVRDEAREQGLTVRATEVDGQTQYEFYATNGDGEQELIVTSDADSYQEDLQNYQQELRDRIENDYNVVINEGGDSADVGGENGSEEDALREPTIQELVGLESGLQRSQPSGQNENGEPLKLYFAQEVTLEGSAAYVTQVDGERIVVFQPYTQRINGGMMNDLVIHELAHVGDHMAHTESDGGGIIDWIDNFLPTGEIVTDREEYAEQLGWHRENNRWIIETEDGRFFHQPDFTSDQFYQTNEDGQYIDEDGNVVENPEDAVAIDESDLAEIALVKPATDYFTTPFEHHAEAIEFYRNGEEGRMELYMMNPELYNIIKEADQREIDAAYPPNADGTPSMIRLPDGSLGENTPDNQQAVADFEAEAEAGWDDGRGELKSAESNSHIFQRETGMMLCGCANCHDMN